MTNCQGQTTRLEACWKKYVTISRKRAQMLSNRIPPFTAESMTALAAHDTLYVSHLFYSHFAKQKLIK